MRSLLIFVTLVIMISCKAQQVSIASVEWRLIKMGDTDLSVINPSVTMILDESKNGISGFAGCNRFFGTYQSSGATISFIGLGSTKMFCQDRMNVEDTYFKTLGNVKSYKTNGGKLYFLSEGSVVLEFGK